MTWAGPVTPEQEVDLQILPPWVVSLWRGVGIVLIVVLLVALSRATYGFPKRLPFQQSGAAAAVAALGLLSLINPSITEAQPAIPDPQLLEELRTRLLEPPECSPRCAELTRAVLGADEDVLTVRLWINALAEVAVPVPGDPKSWLPSRVEVEGVVTSALFRDGAGVLWLRLGPGTHQVMLRGPTPPVGAFSVAFPESPRFVEVNADSWDHAGVSQNRLLSGSIEFVRKVPESDEDDESVAGERFDPFVRVVRRLEFGIDWHVHTDVHRIAPTRGAFTMAIPLLPDESVITPDTEVREGQALVAMPAGVSSVSWRSTLPRGGRIVLNAPEGDWREVWQIAATPIWHVEGAGLPAVSPERVDRNFWVPEYYPHPGETLELEVTRPAGAEGETLAIDNVTVSTVLGKRSRDTDLSFSYRSTRGGQHTVRLPSDAQVLEVTSDGRAIPLRPEEGALPLPIAPGAHHVKVRWREIAGIEAIEHSSVVDLGTASSNIRLGLRLPDDRWILYADGPRVGPAILYWPELLAFIVIAFMLARTRYTPLRGWDWLLLGLGLSTFAWPVLLLVIAWLFAINWRADAELADSRWRFNMTQLALGALSIVAVGALVSAIPYGLLGSPDMHVSGQYSSGNDLNWFQDQAEGQLPSGRVLSVSLWYYKAAMLLWALWLSFALIKWLPWAWRCYSAEGYWPGAHREQRWRIAAAGIGQGGDMSWIESVPYGSAAGRLKNIYDRIKGPDNYIDNILMVHGLRPHTLEGHMSLYKNVLHHSGNMVPKWLLETIGVHVSMLNRCEYCVAHHAEGLARLIDDADRVASIIDALRREEYPDDVFADAERLALAYARALTIAPASVTAAHIDRLRAAGLSDGEILEINQVASYFAYANRTVLGLGVTTQGDKLGLSPSGGGSSNDWEHK